MPFPWIEQKANDNPPHIRITPSTSTSTSRPSIVPIAIHFPRDPTMVNKSGSSKSIICLTLPITWHIRTKFPLWKQTAKGKASTPTTTSTTSTTSSITSNHIISAMQAPPLPIALRRQSCLPSHLILIPLSLTANTTSTICTSDPAP